jgi:hypothetical protein
VPYIVIIPAGADSFHQEGSNFFDNRKFVDGGRHLCRDVLEAMRSQDRSIGEKEVRKRREDCEERKAKSKRKRKRKIKQRSVHVKDRDQTDAGSIVRHPASFIAQHWTDEPR